MITKISAVYFSPTGGTERVTTNIAASLAEYLGLQAPECIDITLPSNREKELNYDNETLVVFGMPVYAGRVPNKITPYYRDHIHGNGALCIVVAVYGNRSFDDALQEMAILAHANTFKVIGAAGCVAEHSMMEGRVAGGRPDMKDLEEGRLFAKDISGLVKSGEYLNRGIMEDIPGDYHPQVYFKPLDMNGQPAVFIKTVPKVDENKCIRCGKCAAVCPVGSITLEETPVMHTPCIKCQACVKKCPAGAIYFDDPVMASHIQMVENFLARDKKDNIWLL